MPTLFWTGKLPIALRLILNLGSIFAWITGDARDSSAMKGRMKDGYNGKYTNYIHKYDELATFHYERISNALIKKIDCRGKEVVDVGCGTGILSFIVLKKGASKISCVDISKLMLEKCREKSIIERIPDGLISFHVGDAERLPFDNDICDIVLLNMVLGMVPNQQNVITELARILRPGGIAAISAHGPEHYMEAIEAGIKSMTMRYFLSHRFEFWPRDENKIKKLFISAGLEKVKTESLTWTDKFENGGEAFDFFASTSGLWWYHRLPAQLRNKETAKIRSYFQRKKINKITSDVVIAIGSKIKSKSHKMTRGPGSGLNFQQDADKRP